MLALLRHALAMVRNVKLVALHLIGNAVLLVSATFWLLIPEAHIWQLLFAGLSALIIVFVFLWIHSGTLVLAVSPTKENCRPAFTAKIWRIVWLLIGAFLLLWCMKTVDGWMGLRWQTAGYLYSKAPMWLRPTAGPDSYTAALEYFLRALYWYVVPCVFLAITAARIYGASFLRGLRILKHWQYWAGMTVTIFLGVWITQLIVAWAPGKSLTQQTVGMVIRMTIIYLITTVSWLLTTGVLGYFVRIETAPETAS